MKNAALLLAFLLCFACSLACADEPVAASPAPAPAAPPARIISCAPNLTEILFALGAGPEVVGVTRYCEHPPEAKAIAKFGDLYAPDLEGMVAARPTLVAVTSTSERVRDFFGAREGVRVVVCTDNDSIAEIAQSIRLLGEATGRSARAEELVAATDRGLAELRERWKDRPTRRVLLVVGREPRTLSNLYVVGRGTYIDELMAAVRVENAVPESMGEWPQLSRETLLALNPEVIVEMHEPADDAARAEMRAAWGGLPPLAAVRNDALLPFANRHITTPSVGLERDAEALGKLVHESAK
jgi:iron complex transport system substrate-binding protein